MAPSAPLRPSFVVALGGSAGSLDAFEQFFASTPADTGMAFVVVTHLDPDHKPLLPELVQKTTAMPVCEVIDGVRLAPDSVYVIPANRMLAIDGDDALHLAATAPRHGPRTPIDVFFRSLAAARGATAIGVVLSGMGADGAEGLRAIHDAGGRTLVQEPSTAAFAAMPRAALAALAVDLIATPDALPAGIATLVAGGPAAASAQPGASAGVEPTPAGLARVLELLRRRTGHDLSLYKPSAIERRLERRLLVHHLPDLAAYADYLEANPDEGELLLRELLIGVTHFFRDEEAFAVLRDIALPALLATKTAPRTLRAWVAGCSSGEEAYSLAIVIDEVLEQLRVADTEVLIYATDLDAGAIASARAGRYPNDIADRVSPARLARYFVREDHGYRICAEIRSTVVFAQHDLITDPPFTRLDILCCRNVLIYLQPVLQQRLLPRFHYALAPGGVLVLGSSESVSASAELFDSIDGKAKVFRKVDVELGPRTRLELPTAARPEAAALRGARPPLELTVVDAARRAIVETVAAPTVVINARGDILYVSRRTGRYLEPAVGKTNVNIFAMAREGLGAHLSLAVRQAVSRRRRVNRSGVEIHGDRGRYLIDLAVVPMTEPAALRGLFLVVFTDVAPAAKAGARPAAKTARTGSAALERELARTKTHLQAVVRDMDAAQGQLEVANEELQSANEELQSTNEELTTSREELQSLNEELLTINAELEAKNRELATANDDLRNVVNSTKIPTLFLDRELRVKRFTSEATRVANLIATDVGRLITDITLRVTYPALRHDVDEVLATLVFKEAQVTSDSGATYTVRIHPYRTIENTIDGVVITFSDVTALRRAEEALAARIHESVVARLLDRWPGLVYVHDLVLEREVYCNRAAQDWLRTTAGGASGEQRFEALLDLELASDTAGWNARVAALGDGDVLTRRLRLRGAGGSYTSFRETTSVLARTPAGQPTQVLAVLDQRGVDGA